MPALRLVEGSAGYWHYHLSETGLNGQPALCGETHVMRTGVPLSAWGHKPLHIRSSYCKACDAKARAAGHTIPEL